MCVPSNRQMFQFTKFPSLCVVCLCERETGILHLHLKRTKKQYKSPTVRWREDIPIFFGEETEI